MTEADSQPTQPPAQDTWDRLLKQTEPFAAAQAAVRWWRRKRRGQVLVGYGKLWKVMEGYFGLSPTRKATSRMRKSPSIGAARTC